MPSLNYSRISSVVTFVSLVVLSSTFSFDSVYAESPPQSLFKFGSSGSGDGQFGPGGPYGIALDSSGNIYVADNDNNRIQKFDSSGNFILKFGSSGSGDGQFTNPKGVVVDKNNNLYVTDSGNDRIQKFDSSGNFILKFSTFYYPMEITVDNSNNILVVDYFGNSVQKFDSSGNFILKFGSSGSGNGQLNNPSDVKTDASNNIFVVDAHNYRIQKFDSSGNFILKFGSSGSGDGQFLGNIGLALDSNGNIFVADNGRQNVQKFDSSGNFILKFGSSGSGDGQFHAPYGLAIDSLNRIFVSENFNHRIQVFTVPPTVITPPNMQITTTNAGGIAVTYPTPTATNSVGGTISPTCTPPSGSTFPIGNTTVTCTAKDAAGSVGQATFTVTVKQSDTTPPIITPPVNQIVIATNSNGMVVNYPAPTATDNVGVTNGPTCNPPSGSTFPIGNTTVTCTASDAAANIGKATFTVTVQSPQQFSPTITTDKQSYSVGNTVVISGTNFPANANLILAILNPNPNVNSTALSITSTNQGQFSTIWTIPSTFGTGTYTIQLYPQPTQNNTGTPQTTSGDCPPDCLPKATYNPPPPPSTTPSVSTKIQVSANTISLPITVSTDKSSYSAGDSIVVSGTVNSMNSINPQQPVTIQTYDTNDNLVRIDTAIPSPSGTYSITIPAHGPLWQNTGTYTLKIKYNLPNTFSQLTFYFNSGNVSTLPVPTPINQPTDIITISNPRIQGNYITANLTNNQDTDQKITYVVQCKDVTGVTTTIQQFSATLVADQKNYVASLSCTGNTYTGNTYTGATYTAQIFVVESLANPVMLSPPISITTGTQAGSYYQNYNFTQILLSGTINPPVVEDKVILLVSDPSGTVVQITQADVGSDGKFSTTIIAAGPLFKQFGTYAVKVYYSGKPQNNLEFDYNVGQGKLIFAYSTQPSQPAPTNPATIFNATPQELASINEARNNQTIAAEVNVVNQTVQTTSIDNNVSIHTNNTSPDSLSISVSASSQTSPKVLVVNLAATTINVANLKDLGVMYDGKPIPPASNIDSILHAKSTDSPSFAIVVTQSGAQILILIPHFSTHTITITNMSKVIPAVPEFSSLTGMIIITSMIGVLTISRKFRFHF
jgi:sugar lactone lactonase YvrE